MAVQNEQFSEVQRKSVDAAMRLAQIHIETSQRFMALQMESARALLDAATENARTMAEAKDPKAVMELRNEYARTTVEKLLDAARRIAKIAADAQLQFSRTIGEQLSGGSKEMMDAVHKALSFDPAAAQAAQSSMASMQQMMDSTRNTFEQLASASASAMKGLDAAITTAVTGQKKGGKKRT
jgi:phasin family protein